MQEEHAEVEQEPLYNRIPLSRILAWNRWWHITARLIVIVYKKKFWGLVGGYLQTVKGIPSCRLAVLRAKLVSKRKRTPAAKKAISVSIRWKLLCTVHYDRSKYLSSYSRKKEEAERSSCSTWFRLIAIAPRGAAHHVWTRSRLTSRESMAAAFLF